MQSWWFLRQWYILFFVSEVKNEVNSSNCFYCFLFKVVILQCRVLDIVFHQPSYSKHRGALLTNLFGISLHTDRGVNSPVSFFPPSAIGLSILLYKMWSDCHSSPRLLATQSSPGWPGPLFALDPDWDSVRLS